MSPFAQSPMRSGALSLATGVSLILFLATLGLWVRGFWVRDGIWYSTDTARYSLQTHHGRIWFWSLSGGRAAVDKPLSTPTEFHPGLVWDSAPDSYYDAVGKRSPRWRQRAEQFTLAAPAVSARPAAVDWQALGFRYLRNDCWLPLAQLPWNYPTACSLAIFAPDWAIALPAGILSAMLLFHGGRRWHRIRRGLCPVCGYDLRASRDRCPECGVVTSRG